MAKKKDKENQDQNQQEEATSQGQQENPKDTLPGMPPDDEIAILAKELSSASDQISEGHELRDEREKELAAALRKAGRKKVHISGYGTFRLVHTEAKDKISVKKDK